MINNRSCDRWILAIALVLLIFGSLMVYSTTSVVAPQDRAKGASEYFYVKKFIVTMILGFIAMLAAYKVRVSSLRRWSIPLLVISIVLLIMVFLPGIGVSAGGARRWIRLWPSTFQPSEFVRLSMVIFLAHYVSHDRYNPESFKWFLPPIAIMGMFQGVFLLQPDFGATMSLGIITLSILFLSKTKMRYLMYLTALSMPVIVKLVMEPYRLRRITSFLNPWDDARGSGFQLVQSFIAFGSGGFSGVGLGNSRQKLEFLPEVHTDFIFSVIGEELGFLTASAVVLLFALLFWRGIKLAKKTDKSDQFTYYLAFGLSLMIALQAIVNFWVVTGLLPTKGLPLPFISYGGSSLLVNMTAIGLLLNLSRVPDGNLAKLGRLNDVIRRKMARRSVYGGVR